MSFASLKRNRANSIEKLRKAAEKQQSGGNYEDPTMWKPTVDQNGNGSAIIRFLPAPESKREGVSIDIPWVQYWDHWFKGPTGKYFIEKSLTTLGQDDPVSEENSRLWNTGLESDKEIARDRKRRLHYVSNIIVIKDPENPQNEGKVFKFEYGKKIWDKINDVMNPEFDDEVPVDPFDFWEGANFRLKIRKVEGWRNYDKSDFDSPSALAGGDEAKLEEIYEQLHDLGEYIDPAEYKSYAELERKMIEVLGDEYTGNASIKSEPVANAPSPKSAEAPSPNSAPSSFDDDDDIPLGGDEDNDLDYFKSMAED